MVSFNFIKIFSDLLQGSILVMRDVRYLFWQYRIDLFPSTFRIQIDKCEVSLEICIKFL